MADQEVILIFFSCNSKTSLDCFQLKIMYLLCDTLHKCFKDVLK